MTRRLSRRSGGRQTSGEAGQRERALRKYLDERELRAIVAYAEVRAIMLAWAGVLREDPIALARRALNVVFRARALRHLSASAFGDDVRAALRWMTAATLYRAGKRLGPPPWDTLGDGQIGDVAGLEPVFHAAGCAASDVRANDPRIIVAAAALLDYVRVQVMPNVRTAPGAD